MNMEKNVLATKSKDGYQLCSRCGKMRKIDIMDKVLFVVMLAAIGMTIYCLFTEVLL